MSLSSESSRPTAAPAGLWPWAAAAAVLVLAGAALHRAGGQQPLFLALQAWGEGVPATVWAALSVLGLGWSGAIVLCALARPGRGQRAVAAMVLAAPLAGLLVLVGKRLFDVPRPAAVLGEGLRVIGERLTAANSMPSGHSISAAAVTALILLGLPLRWPQRLLVAAGGAAVLLSRVEVGAHWPADVLAGAGLGVWAALLAWWAAAHWSPLRRLASGLDGRTGQRRLALAELALGAGLVSSHTGHPDAAWLPWALAAVALASAAARWRATATR